MQDVIIVEIVERICLVITTIAFLIFIYKGSR